MAKTRKYRSPSSAAKVREPLVAYIAGNQAIESILTSTAAIPENHLTSFEKIKMIQSGVSKESLERLKKKAALDYEQLSKALSVTRATLINKKGKEKFGTDLSEKIMSLADIYAYGYEVFEDESAFNEWVFKPNHALNGAMPYDLLNNQYGREEVKKLIGRIDYGVYS